MPYNTFDFTVITAKFYISLFALRLAFSIDYVLYQNSFQRLKCHLCFNQFSSSVTFVNLVSQNVGAVDHFLSLNYIPGRNVFPASLI